jgi:hypothetical protein
MSADNEPKQPQPKEPQPEREVPAKEPSFPIKESFPEPSTRPEIEPENPWPRPKK